MTTKFIMIICRRSRQSESQLHSYTSTILKKEKKNKIYLSTTSVWKIKDKSQNRQASISVSMTGSVNLQGSHFSGMITLKDFSKFILEVSCIFPLYLKCLLSSFETLSKKSSTCGLAIFPGSFKESQKFQDFSKGTIIFHGFLGRVGAL